MLFTPEVHEINVRGTKKPIKGGSSKKGGQMRGRMQDKLDYLNANQFNTLADQ